MKLSVSLPVQDVQFVDAYAQSQAAPSRSAVLHEAIQALRHQALGAAYAAAWREWEDGDDGLLWDGVSADGLQRSCPRE